MIADLIEWALTLPLPTVVTAARAIPVDQLSNMLVNFDLDHSFVATGCGHDPKARVFVCGMEALRSRAVRLGLGDNVDLALVDEAAHSCATIWTEVINSFELANIVASQRAARARRTAVSMGTSSPPRMSCQRC